MKGVIVLLVCVVFLLGNSHAKSDKYEKLLKAVNKKSSSIVEFTDESVARYAKSSRDYHLMVFITTDSPNVGCEACPEFNSAYSSLVKMYKSTLGPSVFNSTRFSQNPIFFARCEVTKCMEFFTQGQYQAFPVLLHFPPTEKESDTIPYTTFDLLNIYESISAESMATEVTQVTGHSLVIEKPFYQDALMYVVGILGVFMLLRFLAPLLYSYSKNPMFWYFAALGVFVFVMSGTVYNSIHTPPFMYVHPQSKQLYLIYPSPRQQFVVEGLIMAVTFGGVFMIAFNSHVATESEPWKQRLFFAIFAFSFFVCFQWTMKIFKMKYPYYPLW